MTVPRRGALLLTATASCGLFAACGEAFQSGAPENGGSQSAGAAAGGEPGEGLPEVGGNPAGIAGDSGHPNASDCKLDDDCDAAHSECVRVSCVDGACVQNRVEESSPCAGGACDAEGRCVASGCSSGKPDGDETDIDCGGSCEPCADGKSCAVDKDCLSGVCGNMECLASACTDKVENGDETGIDCGGSCPLRCALGQGCNSSADCAVAAGEYAESVRCVENVCVSTKPPSQAGGPRYWQDFRPQRLLTGTASCGANDDICLVGNGPAYQMHGLDPTGARKPLTEALFTSDGVVGGAGKFDGTLCLTRVTTNLSLADDGAATVMAWVKPTRDRAPWEGAIIGALAHYFIAVDTNPSSQRFLAALATSQSASFDYRSSMATGEVPNGSWHHVAAVYDTAVAKMLQYVDGKLVHSTAISGNITSGAASVFLGCRKDASLGQFFIGSIDEVVVYTRALSPAELEPYVASTRPAP